MSRKFIITATGTDIGKTLSSAILMLGLDADYWKPIQSGPDHDRTTVQCLTGLPDERFHPEAYCLTQPLSPHRAAEIDGVTIDLNTLTPPHSSRPLLIEGAGGLMVPVTRNTLMIDVFERFAAPIILCARTELGTINHTLLSIEALRKRDIALHGIIFNGTDNPDNIKTILEFSGAKLLGHIPVLHDFSPTHLKSVFDTRFNKRDFV